MDDASAEAHTALALVVQNYDYDWTTSGKEFKRAIELNPNYATAHHWYAEHLMWQGRFDEVLAESDRARQLDPLSLIIASNKGVIFVFSREPDRAIAQLNAVGEMDPAFGRNRIIERAYSQKEMVEKVRSDVDEWPVMDSPGFWSEVVYLDGCTGRPKEARNALQKLLELSHRHPVDPMVLVSAYIGTGDKDAAIASLVPAASVGIAISPRYA